MNYWSQSQLRFSWWYCFVKVDQWFNHSEDTKITSDGIQNRIIPMPRNGSRVSRSGASIVGGMSQN
jgi:hypothetical protein